MRRPVATARNSCLLRRISRFCAAGFSGSGAISRAKSRSRSIKGDWKCQGSEWGKRDRLKRSRASSLRPTNACDRGNGGQREFCGRFWWRDAHGSHGGACEPACWVDRCVSQRILLFVFGLFRGARQAHRHQRGLDLVFPTKPSAGGSKFCPLETLRHWMMAGL